MSGGRRALADLVRESARRHPTRPAVRAAGQSIDYRTLDARADALARVLVARGVVRGDRVGVWLEKGIDAVVALQAITRTGAAYVPIDPLSPHARARLIMGDCAMRCVVTDVARAAVVDDAIDVVCVDGRAGRGGSVDDAVSARVPDVDVDADDLAYILYTSGSTGVPKGVCISQQNALAFIDWCVAAVAASADDVFANHAPFHFDLSVFDLYVAFAVGGCVSVIGETAAYVPSALVDFVAVERPTIWYSVPSALTLMREHGLRAETAASLRVVCFAGEPWPIAQLRDFRRAFPAVRLWNFYGPTETNVCTAFEVKDVDDARVKPVPIGGASCGDRVYARTDGGAVAGVGEEGMLIVEGPTVMLGYWGKARHRGPYDTGDIVVRVADDCFEYVGRRDQMVKLNGFRVELGEIEAAVAAHAAVKDVAVVVDAGAIIAAVVWRDGARPAPLLEMKQHCAARVPRYMIPNKVRALDALPRTRNGKVDRRALVERLGGSA